MKNQKWWTDTKQDNSKLIAWLNGQSYYERKYSEEINKVIENLDGTGLLGKISVLKRISQDKMKHAVYIESLLDGRGQKSNQKEEIDGNYVSKFKGVGNLEEICAVAAYEESKILEKVKTISDDFTAPFDIVTIFQKIEIDKENHVKWFREMTTLEKLEKAFPNTKEEE